MFACTCKHKPLPRLQGEDDDSEPRQLGLFFFKESDAAAMIAKVGICRGRLPSRAEHFPFTPYCKGHMQAVTGSCAVQIQEQSPELAKQSHIMRLTLDKVYDFAITPKENTPAENVVFRFMPDAEQVKHALQVQPVTQRLCAGSYPHAARLHVRTHDSNLETMCQASMSHL